MQQNHIFKSLPKITFAHTYARHSEHYTLYPVEANCVEIAFIRQGKAEAKIFGNNYVFLPGDIMCHFHKTPLEMKYLETCEIHTVIAYFDCEFSEERTDDSFYLPFYTATSESTKEIEKTLDEIILQYNTVSKASPQIYSLFFKLIALIDDQNLIITRSEKNINYSQIMYVNKAKKYIFDHIQRHISLEEIASYLDLSVPYICNIFKKVTGETIIRHINLLKLEKIKNIVTGYNITLSQAGEQVGLYDVHYISRMFKKYYNINITDFRKTRFEELASKKD